MDDFEEVKFVSTERGSDRFFEPFSFSELFVYLSMQAAIESIKLTGLDGDAVAVGGNGLDGECPDITDELLLLPPNFPRIFSEFSSKIFKVDFSEPFLDFSEFSELFLRTKFLMPSFSANLSAGVKRLELEFVIADFVADDFGLMGGDMAQDDEPDSESGLSLALVMFFGMCRFFKGNLCSDLLSDFEFSEEFFDVSVFSRSSFDDLLLDLRFLTSGSGLEFPVFEFNI